MYGPVSAALWISFSSQQPKQLIILPLKVNASKRKFNQFWDVLLMQRRRVEAESVTHKYYNSSTKPKYYNNTRLIGKIIEKTSLANFYSKTHITQITSL